jgi:hypothetical protein
MIKKLFTALFFCAATFSAMAQNETPPTLLRVWMNDGSSVIFVLDDKPAIAVNGLVLSISTSGSQATKNELPVSEVHKFTLTDANVYNVIDKTGMKSNGSIKNNGYEIILQDCKPCSPVNIYSTDGRNVGSYSTDNSGYLTIDLSNLSRGIYIIKTSSLTNKFIKK